MGKSKTQLKNKNGFTVKQQKFIDCFDGDVKSTAKKAGLNYSYCRRIVAQGSIYAAIKNRQEKENAPLIATRQERQKFWTEVMNGLIEGATMRNRIAASELLGRSEADFTDKHIVDDRRSLADVLGKVGAE